MLHLIGIHSWSKSLYTMITFPEHDLGDARLGSIGALQPVSDLPESPVSSATRSTMDAIQRAAAVLTAHVSYI